MTQRITQHDLLQLPMQVPCIAVMRLGKKQYAYPAKRFPVIFALVESLTDKLDPLFWLDVSCALCVLLEEKSVMVV